MCVLSRVQLFAMSWTVTRQAPLSMGFPRQENWSELPFPSSGDLPDPRIEPASPALPIESPGKPSKRLSILYRVKLLPGKSHGRRSLVGCRPWGREESEMTHFHFSLSCTGEGNGNPLQYSCLGNPMDRGGWQATVRVVTKELDTT